MCLIESENILKELKEMAINGDLTNLTEIERIRVAERNSTLTEVWEIIMYEERCQKESKNE